LSGLEAFKPDQKRVTVRPSPNIGERKGGKWVNAIVLHYTGTETGLGAEDWLCKEESQVSAHYIVHENGRIVQMVREKDRAWHAGKSFWKGERDMNSVSVGIEIVNGGHEWGYSDFPKAQMNAVIRLCLGIIKRHKIAPERVLAHSDVAPGRKVDPGEKFPWGLLYSKGIGHYIQPTPIQGGRFLSPGDEGQPVEALQSMLALYGYESPITGIFDVATSRDVKAFQLHFRPERVDGIADFSTIDTLHRLLKALEKPMV
jgi:N-acetylmuramoyl-L-alanine amidase